MDTKTQVLQYEGHKRYNSPDQPNRVVQTFTFSPKENVSQVHLTMPTNVSVSMKNGDMEIGGCHVYATVREAEGQVSVQPIPHIERHSPDGMQWGYGGSGPADCARSILIHFVENDSPEFKDQVDLLYQKFKFEVIASQLDHLLITRASILEWLNQNKRA